ncbi:type II secretion system protein GspD [Ralstonia pseudosolanacearum]|uniref:type II secretion system protein GspD n=1 Tax=Ralstonia pseudosolanacearum TaxID=1310165 RepID=UPI003CF2A651
MKTTLIAALLCASLAACSTNRPIEAPPEKEFTRIKVPQPDQTVGSSEIDELLVSGVNIVPPKALGGEGDALPDLPVPPLSFSNAQAVDVLSAISAATKVPMTFVQEDAKLKTKVVSVRNLSRRLPQLMHELSETMGFYYVYENGVIKVSTEQQFIVPIPPVNDLMESIPVMITRLGASQVFLDKSSRTLTYSASKSVGKRVVSYLQYIRDTKSLLVYDMFFWEVTLNDTRAMGIKWNNFNIGFGPINASSGNRAGSTNITGGLTGNTTGGLGANIVYNGANFSMDLLLNFLNTQGTVSNISQPRLALVSGGVAQFQDGESIEYVKRLGAAISNNTTLSSSETGVIFTGLDVGLAGDESDGTIFTDVQASMGELIRFNDFPSVDGTVQKLPQRSMREIKTKVRARSGDTILLAGINSNRYSGDLNGVPGLANTSLLTSFDKSAARRELVMVLRPRVVRFKHAGDKDFSPSTN